MTDLERAREIVNISSLTNRGLCSSVDIDAELYADGGDAIKTLSLTDDECRELAKETPVSYEEIKAVFGDKKERGLSLVHTERAGTAGYTINYTVGKQDN